MLWSIIITVFLFHFLLSIWLFRYLDMRRQRIKKRIEQIEKKEWNESEKPKHAFSFWDVFRHIKFIKLLDERLQNELKNANILMKSREMVAMLLLFGALGGVIGMLLSEGSIVRGAALAFFTWMLPLIWMRTRKNRRKSKLEAQLPEMINMTANSLKAGYSLLQAFELLSREMPPPLSEEIQRLLQEMRLGVTTEQALQHFNQRIQSKDLDLIVTAMLIQRQVGGNMAEILDTIGNTIRERIRIQGEIKSLTAQGRMSMMIFMILPIGLAAFLSFFNPEYMMVFIANPIGWLMLAIAVFGQIIGAMIIKKIIQIEV